ncbi:MAG: DUF6264 family protein [Microbacterium gubbeenense]
MTNDAEPRPQYGAYASPAEQRARSGQPDPDVDPALIPRDVPPEWDAAPTRQASGSPATTGRLVDRVVTIALLAFGLYSIITGIGLYTDPDALLGALRLDADLSDPGLIRGLGMASIIVMLIGWLATTWLVWRRGAAGKSMWWIALIAGVVFTFLGAMLVAVPLAMEPGVSGAVIAQQGLVG